MAETPAAASAEQLLQRLEWTVLRRLDGLLQGDWRTLWRGGGVDLADLREYQTHDDVRHIDWNVTARLQQPYVRQFLEDRDLTAWFLLDLSGSVDFGSADVTKLAVSAGFVATLARVMTRHGNRVGALLYGTRVDTVLPPRASRLHVLELLQRMRQPRPRAPAGGAGTALADLLRMAEGTIKRRSLVFVVSDFISQPGWDSALARLARRHDVVAVRLFDPMEMALPDVGLVTLEDAETGEQIFVDAADPVHPGPGQGAAQLAFLGRCQCFESFQEAGRLGIHQQLLATLGIFQRHQPEVGQGHLGRVIKAHGQHLVPLRQSRQRLGPAGRADEVRHHEHQRTSLDQGARALQQITQHGLLPAHACRALAHVGDELQYLVAPHAWRQHGAGLAGRALAIEHGAHPIAMPREQARNAGHKALGHRELGAIAGAEIHAARQIEQKPGRELAVLGVLPHVRDLQAGGHVPVDVAHVVAVLVFAQVGQIQAATAPQRAVVALQQAVQAAQHRPLQPAQQGLRVVCTRGLGGGGGAHCGCCSGLSGTATRAITCWISASGVRPSASAS